MNGNYSPVVFEKIRFGFIVSGQVKVFLKREEVTES